MIEKSHTTSIMFIDQFYRFHKFKNMIYRAKKETLILSDFTLWNKSISYYVYA